jgi:predicted secreted protein
MQRFTAAHELGHFVLEHEGSLDREIRYPGQTENRDLKELAADSFAAEFLMPKWLFVHHARRHGWSTEQLHDPLYVYQLSLRMAVSYEATCFGLLAHNILDWDTVARLRGVAPKKSKQRLLGDVTIDDYRSDVWLLDERDNGGKIDAGPGDIFVLNLLEHSGSGHLWDPHMIEDAGFEMKQQICEEENANAVGGPTRRRFMFRDRGAGARQLGLNERRPWEANGTAISSVSISISTFGAEVTGLSRRARPSYQAPALH